jgi:hypothetical protein
MIATVQQGLRGRVWTSPGVRVYHLPSRLLFGKPVFDRNPAGNSQPEWSYRLLVTHYTNRAHRFRPRLRHARREARLSTSCTTASFPNPTHATESDFIEAADSQPPVKPPKCVRKHERYGQDPCPQNGYMRGLAQIEAADTADQHVGCGKG